MCKGNEFVQVTIIEKAKFSCNSVRSEIAK